jgi:hypothetical protein
LCKPKSKFIPTNFNNIKRIYKYNTKQVRYNEKELSVTAVDESADEMSEVVDA